MKRILSVLSFLFVFSSTAHAGLLLDPYFNYITSGKYDTSTTSSSVTGNEIGARVGWNVFMGLGFGVDALLSGKWTYSNNGTSSDITPSYYGVFASYQFPILFRGYLSYLLSVKAKDSSGDYSTGTGTKIGVQYTGLPFVALGVEMYNVNHDKANIGGTEFSVSNKETHTNITLSVPFNL